MSVPNRSDRRSIYIDYAAGEYYPSSAYTRARSLTRDASIARIHKLDHVDCAYYHHRMKSIEKDLNESAQQLGGINKEYHNMHADFLNRQLRNEHYIGAIEEHVDEQGVQLNRILSLLEQEEFELRKRMSLYRSKSRRRIRPVSSYQPFRDIRYSSFEPSDLSDRLSRLSHYSVESQPRISHQPKVNISELDAQLEQIKEKNRRYKPSLTQKCVDFEEEENEDGESASERRARERREREEKMDAEQREREEARQKARKEREEMEERDRLEKEEREMKDLFASRNIDVSPLKDSKVIFVIGGPGSGKGTQCAKMVDRYGYCHISSGDLLRKEVNSGSRRGRKLNEIMKKGGLVPDNVVLDMIKEAMLANVDNAKGFLIDGYPRKVDQGIEFEKEIVPCQKVFLINASDASMKDRLLSRGKNSGRVDDNEESLKARLETYHEISEPVINHYDKLGKLERINSEGSPDAAFTEIKKILDDEEGVFDFDDEKDIDVSPLKNSKVIFVVGGPGSGKGTQCDKMVDRYGYTHISSGDLLRAEVASGSERGQKLDKIMKKGALVPNKVVLNMIKEAMLAKASSSNGFLIDGYPRKVEQGVEFEKEIIPCTMCLYIDAADKTMKDRLMNRGKTSGRADDNEATINERIKLFHKETKPVISHYDKQGKLKTINAEKETNKVFDDIKKILDKVEGIDFDTSAMFKTSKKIDTSPLKDSTVLFIIGGPGSGKGTQCEKIVKKYGYTHISSGDLLRSEVANGTEMGQKLEKLMKRGLLVPDNVVLDLIKEKMLSELSKGAKGFLIDGYPRQVEQGVDFEKEIVPCALVLNMNCSDESMKSRMLERGKTSGRSDDNEESIKQRLKVFHECSKPVIDYYDKNGKLRNINAENKADQAFAECKKHIDKFNRDNKIASWKDHINKFDETVDEIVHCVMNNASKGREVKQNVSSTIQSAIRELIASEMEPNEETGFDYLEYDHLEIFKGPSKLMKLAGNGINDTEANLHGEIIIRVQKGHKVTVEADSNHDTIISNVDQGEIIIRNVDTNLVLNLSKNGKSNDHIDLSIVGQAYIRDLSGNIKAEQFQGIVVIKNDL